MIVLSAHETALSYSACCSAVALYGPGYWLPSSPAGTPTQGGTITYLTIAEQFNHVDPQRNYTGQDLAFFGSYVNRTLTSYAHAEGPAGAELVADMATDTGTTPDGGKTWSFTLRDCFVSA